MAPVTRSFISTAVSTRPTSANQTGAWRMSPRATKVDSSATTMPAFFIPISARKPPIPAVIAIFSDIGSAFTIARRAPTTLRTTKSTPEMNTAASAACQV